VKPLLIHREAQKEIDATFLYSEGKREDLGFEFVDEVERATNLFQQLPKLHPKVANTDFRRCVLKRFPYLIFYRETDTDIRVVAVAHCKRKPGYWKNRRFEDE
jgi:toxin ParE1/3/4